MSIDREKTSSEDNFFAELAIGKLGVYILNRELTEEEKASLPMNAIIHNYCGNTYAQILPTMRDHLVNSEEALKEVQRQEKIIENTNLPPTLKWRIASFKKIPQNGINLYILADGIQSGEITAEQQTELNDYFIQGYNQALHACFPRDAFDILRGQNMIAANIPPQEHLNLDKEWEEITQLIKINIPQNEITTETAFKHFKTLKREDFPEYKLIVQKISLYISECIRRAHKEKDPSLLAKVIPTFKLLAYLHKLHEGNHYFCESEYNEMVRFGVDQTSLQFIFLSKKEITEKFF